MNLKDAKSSFFVCGLALRAIKAMPISPRLEGAVAIENAYDPTIGSFGIFLPQSP